jgi:deoxyribodipyrimidine photo-lyase
VKALIWFRSDLRIADNPALAQAVARADEACVAIFVATPDQWRGHDWGPAKVDFLLRNLQSLSSSLAAAGIPLLFRRVADFEAVPAELLEVATRHQCNELLFNREYEVNERRRDEEVRRALEAHSIAVSAFDDQTLVPPGALLTGQGRFYSVFTPFKKRWLRHLLEQGLPEPSPAAVASSRGGPEPDLVPASLPGFEEARALDRIWPAGENEAHDRLARFVADRAEAYDRQRDLPAGPGTSRLSPYLALGVISPRSCLAAAVAANRGELESGRRGLATWISELAWRDFYRHVLIGFPQVSKGRAFRPETEAIAWLDPEPKLEAWCEGRTGVPFVDAGMRQLLATGWMHNRLRMVTAMFLAKDLLIDWRHGERFFSRQLIDADLANNNGGWQWAASTGTDAAPYFRIFNPWTQGRRFDPDGLFIKRYVPELAGLDAAALHAPRRLAAARLQGLPYPEPIVDHGYARSRAIEAFEAIRRPPTGTTR